MVGEDTVFEDLTLSPDPEIALGVVGGEVGDTRGAIDVNVGATLGIVGEVAFFSIIKESLENPFQFALVHVFIELPNFPTPFREKLFHS